MHAQLDRGKSNLWTSFAGSTSSQAEQTHLGPKAASTSADDSKQSSAMDAVIAAEAEDLAVPLQGPQILPAGLAEQNMAQGKAASP